MFSKMLSTLYWAGPMLALITPTYSSPTPMSMEEHCAKHNNATNNSNGAAGSAPVPPSSLPAGAFTLSFTNVMNTNTQVYAYCMGKDIATGKLAWLSAQGNSFFHPETASTTPVEIPQSNVAIALGPPGSTTQIIVPGFLNSARVYLSVGPMKQSFVAIGGGAFGQVQSDVGNPGDPNAGVDWGFMEFNWESAGGLFADISAVDHVGIPIGISLETTDGKPAQEALGLSSSSVNDVCAALRAQTKVDGQPWDQLCVPGPGDNAAEPLRVIGPQHYRKADGSGGFEGYFREYVDKVWTTYAGTPLTFDLSKQGYGKVNCKVEVASGGLKCGSEPAFAKPNDADIFGCSTGPFAVPAGASGCYKSIVPMLCAGIQRGTLLLSAGAVQPSPSVSAYYTGQGPFNWYSKVTHANEWEGKGYAFPYDDVDSLSGEAVAGTAMTSATTVKQLRVIVGGYDRMKLYGQK